MFFSKWNNNNTIFSIRVTENIFYSPSGKVVWLIWANQRADRVSNAATFVETWGGMVIRRKPSRHWAQSPPHIWGAVYSDGLIPIKYEQVTHDGQWIHLPSDQVFPVFPGRGSWLMYGTFPVLRLQRFECSRGARIRVQSTIMIVGGFMYFGFTGNWQSPQRFSCLGLYSESHVDMITFIHSRREDQTGNLADFHPQRAILLMKLFRILFAPLIRQ